MKKYSVLVSLAVLVLLAFFTLVVGACATIRPERQCMGETVWDDDMGCICPNENEVAHFGEGYAGVCLTKAEEQEWPKRVKASMPIVFEIDPPPPFYSCTKDGTWTDEAGHQGCDKMCSLYRGQKWDREKRECVTAGCQDGFRWSHIDQTCVTFCRGGTFKGWDDAGDLLCDCPEGQSWDRFGGKCATVPNEQSPNP